MNNRPNCEGCKFYGNIMPTIKGCNYCYITGKLRGCPVEKCTKKVQGEYIPKEFCI